MTTTKFMEVPFRVPERKEVQSSYLNTEVRKLALKTNTENMI